MRIAALVLSVTLLPGTTFALRAKATAPAAPTVSLATDFTVTEKTSVPGKTLSAGSYTISIVEHLSDRVILQISDRSGKVEATFLGLNNSKLLRNSKVGAISWPTHKDAVALRGFAFPGSSAVEFVYPKLEAVAIAKENTDQVLAIDPESDNLHLTDDSLSKQDMKIVTLWALDSKRVGPNDAPAISASRYQAPPSNEVASATPPPAIGPTRAESIKSAVPTAHSTSAPVRRPSIAALPHTASNFPVILLAGLMSFVGALGLRYRRIRKNEI